MTDPLLGAEPASAAASELETLIAGRTASVSYQPIVSIETRSVARLEAHLRVPSGRTDALISEAERRNKASVIDFRVMREACQAAEVWRSAGLEAGLSVNVSPTSLITPGAFFTIYDLIESSVLEPADVVVEIRSRPGLAARAVSRVVDDLRAYGVRIAVDDFGTSYGFADQVARRSADEVKIRRVGGHAAHRERADAVAASVAAMARSLGIVTTLQHVESALDFEFARRSGFDFVQGNHCGESVALEEVVALHAQPPASV